MAVKLPKQWRHWCRKAGLRPAWLHGQSHHSWFNLKGHGRVWRVTCNETFQRGDTYEEFDRWALCDIIEIPMPETEAKFVDFVKGVKNG